jgi:hypothetical protein
MHPMQQRVLPQQVFLHLLGFFRLGGEIVPIKLKSSLDRYKIGKRHYFITAPYFTIFLYFITVLYYIIITTYYIKWRLNGYESS